MADPRLTKLEYRVLEHLACAWNDFVALGEKHPDDDPEFCRVIHDAQALVAVRVARRVNPEVWNR